MMCKKIWHALRFTQKNTAHTHEIFYNRLQYIMYILQIAFCSSLLLIQAMTEASNPYQ